MNPQEELTVALSALADKGVTPPCASDPERWTGDDIDTHPAAALDCMGCPILAACRTAAADASWGVWAGRCHCNHKRTS